MTEWVMTIASALPTPAAGAGEETHEARRQGFLHNKQSGSFHKTWVRCWMVVREDSVSLFAVRLWNKEHGDGFGPGVFESNIIWYD